MLNKDSFPLDIIVEIIIYATKLNNYLHNIERVKNFKMTQQRSKPFPKGNLCVKNSQMGSKISNSKDI